MGDRATTKAMSLDDAGEALALGGAHDGDLVALREDVGFELGAGLDALGDVAPELDDPALRLAAGLLVLTGDGLGDPRLLDRAKAEPGGGVAILLDGAKPDHGAGACLKHGHGHGNAALVKDLGHAHLAGDEAFGHSLISMFTPLGSERRISASTTLGLGSRMSMLRLCVRISNCSRESLSMNGPRITVYLLISVGSGMGPAIDALVRRAVSTILSAAESRTLWS